MKRNKRNSVKNEKPETSSSTKLREEHDLAYYVHDRVALMREVFTVLKAKEIKKITPACVGDLSIDNLEELCLEELLGISSKRLCAILDGADPPTDTESSSDSDQSDKSESEDVEVISLSSSGESRRSGTSKKRKNKTKKQKQKEKKKKKHHKRQSSTTDDDASQNNDVPAPSTSDRASKAEQEKLIRATRAGMTVLELLELEARARAIKAQLEKASAQPSTSTTADPKTTTTAINPDPDVEIKEEEPVVLIISSDDDEQKPSIEELEKEEQRSAREKESEIAKEREKETELELLKQQERDKNTFLEKQKTKLEKKAKKKEDKTKKKLEAEKEKQKREAMERDKLKLAEIEKEIERIQKKKDDDVVIIDEDSQPPEPKRAETTKTKKAEHKSDKNYLTITVPRTNTNVTRKVKVNKDNFVISVTNVDKNTVNNDNIVKRVVSSISEANFVPKKKLNSTVSKVQKKEKLKSVVGKKIEEKKRKKKEKGKDKDKDKEKDEDREKQRVIAEKEDVDQDEITLQLSDSEKLDLLEDLEGAKKVDSASSDSSDSDTDSESDNENSAMRNNDKSENEKNIEVPNVSNDISEKNEASGEKDKDCIPAAVHIDKGEEGVDVSIEEIEKTSEINDDLDEKVTVTPENGNENGVSIKIVDNVAENVSKSPESNTKVSSSLNVTEVSEPEVTEVTEKENEVVEISHKIAEQKSVNNQICIESHDPEVTEIGIPQEHNVVSTDEEKKTDITETITDVAKDKNSRTNTEEIDVSHKDLNSGKELETSDKQNTDINKIAENEEDNRRSDLSEGEITDASSEVEAFDVQPVVFCISDEDDEYCEKPKKKSKKKSKEKSKEKTDIHKKADNNIYKDKIEVEPNIVLELVDMVVSEKATTYTPKAIELTSIEKLREELKAIEAKLNPESISINDDDDDIYEIMELSDDSSCYEVEGTYLSKEPTAEEIEALSARIDEIKREDIADELILEHERAFAEKSTVGSESIGDNIDINKVDIIKKVDDEVIVSNIEGSSNVGDNGSEKVDENGSKTTEDDEIARKVDDIESRIQEETRKRDETDIASTEIVENEENLDNVSWKDRYLDSKKVKKVLSTSNILNALRKKNLELKKKMIEAKKAEIELQERLEREKELEKEREEKDIPIEEGSIEHYNMLQGSTKYVDPIKEATQIEEKAAESKDIEQNSEVLTKDMKKDAKTLLKMFKRLLKYNDMNKDPNKVKKKKKKSKDKEKQATA